jgi:hypothetical protein
VNPSPGSSSFEREFRWSTVGTVFRRSIVTVCILVGICAAQTEPKSFSFPPEGRHVMPVSLGKSLLHPCSRSAPTHVTAFWEPTEKEIDDLETRLLPYLTVLAKAGTALPPAELYDRQFVGIVRKGRKLIYVNFFPPGFRENDPGHQVIDICDGGPRHWGIVFDPKRAVFSELSFSNMG